jgi:hypothetical protein
LVQGQDKASGQLSELRKSGLDVGEQFLVGGRFRKPDPGGSGFHLEPILGIGFGGNSWT